jgi:uncharacterized protein (TIGR03086 family)
MALVDLYRDSVEAFTRRAAAVRPDQWSAPTPCSEWDVRALVNHVVYEQRWSVPLLTGATLAEVGDRFEGDLLGDDPAGNAADAGDAARAVVSEPGAMERTVDLSAGPTPAVEYVAQLFADHLVHGWDLAVAIDADRTLDPAAVKACLDWFADREGSYRRAGIIGPAIDLPPSATAQDRLLAAFGRNPQPPVP